MEKYSLLPCPFCGGEARITYGAKRKDAYGRECTVTVVSCENCGARVQYTRTQTAVNAWNRRTNDGNYEADIPE